MVSWTEKPMIVSIAVTKSPSTSVLRNVPRIAKIPTTTITSWTIAASAVIPKRKSRKRNVIQARMPSDPMSTRRIACCVSSAPITGPTVVRLRCESIGPSAASSAVTSVPTSPDRVTPPGMGVGDGEGLGLGDAAGDADAAAAAAAEAEAAGLGEVAGLAEAAAGDADAAPAAEAEAAGDVDTVGDAEVAALAAADGTGLPDGAGLPDEAGDALGAGVVVGPAMSPSGTA